MEILYSDRNIAVCVKPVGLDSEQEVPQALRETLGGEIFPLHRLDKNVGGIMVFARTKAAAAQFSRMIQEGKLIKEYVAMVHGTPPQAGDWQDLLWKETGTQGCESRTIGIYPAHRERSRIGAHSAAYRKKPPNSCAIFFPGIPTGG